MKNISLALVLLLIAASFAVSQDISPEPHKFKFSSLNTPFATQGEFEGEYSIYSSGVGLRITKADIKLSEHCPYKGRRLLTGIQFGLATIIQDKQWKIVAQAPEFPLEQIMRPGGTLNLGELYFFIPKDDQLDLSKYWLVVQIAETTLDSPAGSKKGYAFAHSCHDIFTQEKCLSSTPIGW